MSNGEKIARFMWVLLPGTAIAISVKYLFEFIKLTHSTPTGFSFALTAFVGFIFYGVMGYTAAIDRLNTMFPNQYTGRFNQYIIRNQNKIDTVVLIFLIIWIVTDCMYR